MDIFSEEEKKKRTFDKISQIFSNSSRSKNLQNNMTKKITQDKTKVEKKEAGEAGPITILVNLKNKLESPQMTFQQIKNISCLYFSIPANKVQLVSHLFGKKSSGKTPKRIIRRYLPCQSKKIH